MAGGAPRPSLAPWQPRLPEPRVVPHDQRRHHLHARQVGVPLVRRLGPCLPHAPHLDRGPRLREAADGDDAPRGVPASQRPDSRLRVELQRREPAGARLGDAVPAPHRAGPAGRGRSGLPQGGVQQAHAELHLVGEPQGPVRQERLRGRVPRPRQHRGLRPERPASHRRLPGAGGRHRVDGPLHPEHAGARQSSSPATTESTRTWPSSSWSIFCILPRP